MSSNKKFKRDYIILESKDMNFRYKERILPKAFAKIEINDDKSIVALYVENLKYMKDGYRVIAIRSDYETIDLGKITLSEQGKGEFVLNLDDPTAEIKGIALLYEKTVPLIGFKGSKIENYEEILFMGDEDEYPNTEEDDVYEEVEYIEVDDDDDVYEEYEEIEYIEIEEDDEDNTYEEIEEIENINGVEEIEEVKPIQETYIRNSQYEDNINDYKTLESDKKAKPHRRSRNVQTATKKNTEIDRKQTQQNTYQEHNNKVPGTLLMPRQIKKGLKYFRETKPFVNDYIENARWWKIDITPTTLCGYTMPYLGYLNTLNYTMYSDCTMQAYKYRHYLFGVQYDEYNKRKNYIYAVPGRKEEQPDQGHTGFSVYQPCDDENDNLGYWLCYIDSRSRRILK
ncbi:hypothetical protein [Romboutsia sp. 1001713B170207_170306_H8]|uniref:hypothetical protein n=1 Tax=Romboutsia sp. 1001713B170207_170306_H8 TaxID=2787112 RepID=UPI00189905E7